MRVWGRGWSGVSPWSISLDRGTPRMLLSKPLASLAESQFVQSFPVAALLIVVIQTLLLSWRGEECLGMVTFVLVWPMALALFAGVAALHGPFQKMAFLGVWLSLMFLLGVSLVKIPQGPIMNQILLIGYFTVVCPIVVAIQLKSAVLLSERTVNDRFDKVVLEVALAFGSGAPIFAFEALFCRRFGEQLLLSLSQIGPVLIVGYGLLHGVMVSVVGARDVHFNCWRLLFGTAAIWVCFANAISGEVLVPLALAAQFLGYSIAAPLLRDFRLKVIEIMSLANSFARVRHV